MPMDKALFSRVGIAAALKGAAARPVVRRLAYALALLLMVGGTWVSFSKIELRFSDLSWSPLVALVLLGIPATVALNALEMELSANFISRRFGLRRSLTLTVFASASNMLPLPGAAMVRVAGLASVGGTVRRATAVTLLIALMWLGVAFAFSGAFLLSTAPLMGGLALAVGLSMVTGLVGWGRVLTGRWRTGLRLVALKACLVTVSVARLYLCFMIIGEPALPGQVVIFAISGIVGSAVSIVPAGLGVRELVSAGLAPLVGLSAASAFLATALDRVVGMIVMVGLAAVLTAADLRPTPAEDKAA